MTGGRFDGQVAIITGGAGGIGRAVAGRLVAEGAEVVLVDSDATGLETAAAEIGAASTVAADVSDERAVASYVRHSVERHGGVDLFFNNAGIGGRRSSMSEQDVSEFDRVMAVNVRGVFLGLRDVLKQMKMQGRGGSIVNTASMGGIRGSANLSAYVASKHAVIGLTRSAALDGAPSGIRVNAVAPGHIDTRMARELFASAAPDDPARARREREEGVPLKRFGTPEEVASLVAWLLSDEASYVTGSIQLIDGGLNA